jgi:hypothetical protein
MQSLSIPNSRARLARHITAATLHELLAAVRKTRLDDMVSLLRTSIITEIEQCEITTHQIKFHYCGITELDLMLFETE